MSNRHVATALGISRNTVNNYVKTFQQHQLNFSELGHLTATGPIELFPQADYKDTERCKQLTGCFP